MLEELSSNLAIKVTDSGFYCPDSIIAGSSTTAFYGHYRFDNDQIQDGIQITRFYTGIKPYSSYQVNTHDNLAYGLAIAHF